MTQDTPKPATTPAKPDAEVKPAEDHEESLLDEALMESFPASDPVSPQSEADRERQRAERERGRDPS